MAQEVELKLAFPPTALRAILAHPLIASARKLGRASTLENTYFDTPGQALGEARIALRTRRIGTRRLQTIKCARHASGGLSSRPEWEHPYRGEFDFSPVDDPATRALLDTHADSIIPLFSTVFRRETREYHPRPGLRILLMIDTGSVQAAGREAPIAELELELAEGEATDLIELALQLAADLPLQPEDVSKAERGYQLFHGSPPRALRATRCQLDPAASLADSFRTLASEALRGWQGNALGALQHQDPEFIHQLRVALRRLRTLLRLYAAHLPLGFAGNWQLQLAQLADSVGGARDLDVLHDSVLAAPRGAPDAPDFTPLLAHLRAEAAAARERASAHLAAPASRLLLLQFCKALYTLPTASDTPPLRDFARASLQALRKRVASRLRRAAETTAAEDLHSLRIACKRLRYACEFFSSLFDDRTMRRYQRPLAELLDSLGELNDIEVGNATLQTWLARDPELSTCVIWVGGWHAAQTRRRTAQALRRATTMLEQPAPWQKSRNKKTAK